MRRGCCSPPSLPRNTPSSAAGITPTHAALLWTARVLVDRYLRDIVPETPERTIAQADDGRRLAASGGARRTAEPCLGGRGARKPERRWSAFGIPLTKISQYKGGRQLVGDFANIVGTQRH